MTDIHEHLHSGDGVSPVPGLEDEEPAPFQEASIIDLLHKDVEELNASKEVYIPMKGYENTGMQIRYRLPERGKELDNIASNVRRETKDNYTRNLIIAMDVMIELCTGIFVQPGNTPEPVPLDPEDTGEPCKFDQRLAELLGMPEPVTVGARRVLKQLFGNNDMAIISHSEKLNRWLANTKADVSLEIWQVGE